ncbi:MAG: hypothetical protein VX416_15335, partial [Pseudomonadota bacterium]|nr:hypothetical protein [Pseudomonadota bacterium]
LSSISVLAVVGEAPEDTCVSLNNAWVSLQRRFYDLSGTYSGYFTSVLHFNGIAQIRQVIGERRR